MIPWFDTSTSNLYLSSVLECTGKYSNLEDELQAIAAEALEKNLDESITRSFFQSEIVLFWFYPDEIGFEKKIESDGVLSGEMLRTIVDSALSNGCMAMKYVPGIGTVVSELFDGKLTSEKIGNHIFFSRSEDIIKMVIQNNSFIENPDKSIILKYETVDYILELKNAYDFLNLEIKKKKSSNFRTFKIENDDFTVDKILRSENVRFISPSNMNEIYDYIEVKSGEVQWQSFMNDLGNNLKFIAVFYGINDTSIFFYGKFDTILKEYTEKWGLNKKGNIYTFYENIDFYIYSGEEFLSFSNSAENVNRKSGSALTESFIENSLKILTGKNIFEFGTGRTESGELYINYSYYEGNLEKSIFRFYKN